MNVVTEKKGEELKIREFRSRPRNQEAKNDEKARHTSACSQDILHFSLSLSFALFLCDSRAIRSTFASPHSIHSSQKPGERELVKLASLSWRASNFIPRERVREIERKFEESLSRLLEDSWLKVYLMDFTKGEFHFASGNRVWRKVNTQTHTDLLMISLRWS